MTTDFDTLKAALPITDVLAFYGVEVTRTNKALCPLHNEKTPSFTVYPNTNSWHCFGCGTGGSIIDFVMAYAGVSALEAAKQLNSDFDLGLFEGKPPQEEVSQRQVHKQLAGVFDGYMNKAYTLLCDYLHLLEDWSVLLAPTSFTDMNPLFVEACHQRKYIEYLVDGLRTADYNEQIQFYQTYREEMMHIAKRIKQHSEGTATHTTT